MVRLILAMVVRAYCITNQPPTVEKCAGTDWKGIPHERLKGKPFNTQVSEFGESVHALKLAGVGTKWDFRCLDGVC